MNERMQNIERIMEQMNIDASIRLEEDKERREEENKVREEADRKFNERFDKMVLESEKDRKKAEKQREKDRKEAKKETKEMKQVMIGMGLTQGDISEEIIADNFGNVFNDIGEHISSVERNLIIYTSGGKNKRVRGEFDIIGTNGSKIFLGETKTKLTKTHIDKFINTTMPNFKKYDNRHDGMTVYGVVGARIFANDKVLPYAIKHGLYVIKETHKGTAEILKESLVGVKSF